MAHGRRSKDGRGSGKEVPNIKANTKHKAQRTRKSAGAEERSPDHPNAFSEPGNDHRSDQNQESWSPTAGPVRAVVSRWILNADLRNRHDGLAGLSKKLLKIDVNKLEPGEMIMFINSSWTQFVLYCANHILIHHKRPDGKHLNPKALKLVPEFMIGQRIDYVAALKKAVCKEFKQQYPILGKDL